MASASASWPACADRTSTPIIDNQLDNLVKVADLAGHVDTRTTEGYRHAVRPALPHAVETAEVGEVVRTVGDVRGRLHASDPEPQSREADRRVDDEPEEQDASSDKCDTSPEDRPVAIGEGRRVPAVGGGECGGDDSECDARCAE